MGIKNGRTRKPMEDQPAQPDQRAHGAAILRVERRSEADGNGPQVRILLTNLPSGREDIDITRSFTGGIAHALWMARAGDDTANWVEAERILEQCLAALAERPERKAGARPEMVSGPLPEPAIPGLRRQMAKSS